jgi:hypothetical protein
MSETNGGHSNGRAVLGRGVDLTQLRRVVKIDIPGLPWSVYIRELSVNEFENLPTTVEEQLALILVNEDGERLYQTPEEQQSLKNISLGVTRFLLSEGMKVNGATAEMVDSAIKNFASGPSTGSVTDSPRTLE